MKYINIFQKRNRFLFHFAILNFFCLKNLPEHYDFRFFTLANLTTQIAPLFVSSVFTFMLQKHLIQKGIWLLAYSIVSATCYTAPRLRPRNDTIFQLLNNSVCYLFIDIKLCHDAYFLSLMCRVVYFFSLHPYYSICFMVCQVVY